MFKTVDTTILAKIMSHDPYGITFRLVYVTLPYRPTKWAERRPTLCLLLTSPDKNIRNCSKFILGQSVSFQFFEIMEEVNFNLITITTNLKKTTVKKL